MVRTKRKVNIHDNTAQSHVHIWRGEQNIQKRNELLVQKSIYLNILIHGSILFMKKMKNMFLPQHLQPISKIESILEHGMSVNKKFRQIL